MASSRKVLVEKHITHRGPRVFVALRDRREELTMSEAEDLAALLVEIVESEYESEVLG